MVAAAGLAAAAITWLITSTGNDPSAGASAVRAISVLVPISVGLVIWTRPPSQRFGALLVAGGFVTFLASLGGSDQEVVYSVGRIANWLAEITLVYLVLAFPSGWLRSRTDRGLVAGLAIVVLVLFLPTALMTDAYPVPAAWTTCTEGCPGNAFQLLAHEPAWIGDIVPPLREALLSLLFLAVTLRLLRRLTTATTTMRRSLTPVLALAVVHAVALPVGFALRRAGDTSGVVLTVTWVLASGIPVMALGFLVGAARWRLAVGAGLYRLAPRLHAGIDPETLRQALADALDDPSVELAYWSSDGRWLDTEGRWVALPAGSGRAYTVITDGESEVAAILHDDALRDHRDFVLAVGGLAVVVLTNQRLAAQVEASLQEVRRSRERILAVADEERRRIERDLHDGAQQRLVALRIKLQLASERSVVEHLPDAEQLHQLSEDVGEALDEVRSLAAGVYPSLLVDCGLEEALQSIARRSPLPASVAAQGVGRFPQPLEAAVYFCCLEALQNAAKHAGARSVSVVVSNGDGLRFEVRDDGCGFDVVHQALGHGLTNIHDRLVAVGGTLRVDSRPGRGTRIAGTIPLTPGHPAAAP